jgi:hypothetical protein
LPFVWHDWHGVVICAPVNGNAVVEWLNVDGFHTEVE